MPSTEAPGLRGDWLNGWLAALGITVLLADAHLRWTGGGAPHAVIEHDGHSLAERVTEALPPPPDLARLVIAKEHSDSEASFPRNVPLAAYRSRAALARRDHDWSLSSSVTDLGRDEGSELAEHSPFDPPAPRGETLHDRVLRCRDALAGDIGGWVSGCLDGAGRRIKANGLGFDHRRLIASGDAPVTFVDPVIELLAFFGLSFFTVRGTGRRSATRGWTGPPSRRGSFRWPVWAPSLDRWAVDALLDAFYAARARAQVTGVTGVYQTVPYVPKASSDATRAFASERVP